MKAYVVVRTEYSYARAHARDFRTHSRGRASDPEPQADAFYALADATKWAEKLAQDWIGLRIIDGARPARQGKRFSVDVKGGGREVEVMLVTDKWAGFLTQQRVVLFEVRGAKRVEPLNAVDALSEVVE